jgi:hypothetical protein
MEYRAFVERGPVCAGFHAGSSVGASAAPRIARVLIPASRFSVGAAAAAIFRDHVDDRGWRRSYKAGWPLR